MADLIELPPPSPALTLNMAADKLRRAAQAALDRQAEDGRSSADWARGMDNYLGGPIGAFCGLLSPELALDLADFLDATAAQAVRYAAGFGNIQEEITDGYPIRTAQRILAGAS
jgi:hypothetical protein